MTNVTVNITAGTDKENVTAATLGDKRWGLNGGAQFGQPLAVAAGDKTITIYKTTNPTSIAQARNVPDQANVTFNVTVNQNAIVVAVA
ncbi:hypothetical protein [Polaromonas sp. YR568]|uniref:hypothetical protein n=1 Tax=Polaromonas sp. YR568 TaxID=1855301 RepID=UPI00398BDFF9